MRLQSHVRFQVTGVPCPSPWARGAEKCRPSRPSPSEDKRCRHLPPPVRSQKKIPFPQISNQNAILPGLRNPPENPLPAVTRSILPQTTGAIPLRRAILRQKHNIPIHRHIRQHPSPQTHKLNGGPWKTLESNCRKWALRDSALIIISGPILTDRLSRRIGTTGVIVPERYFKVVLAPYANPPRGIAFIMNNYDTTGGVQPTATTIDEVETITGFDFFAALPDEIENQVESQSNYQQWQRLKTR